MDSLGTVRGHRVWRALDQPASFFGIRGRFMTLFLMIAAAAAVIALCIGSSMGSMIGMLTAAGLIFCDYMLILSIQAKMSEKAFSRMISKGGMTRFIKVTPASVKSHLKRKIEWK